MSDLELSDTENFGAESEDEEVSQKPTFSKSTNNPTKTKLKNTLVEYDEEGNVVADYGEGDDSDAENDEEEEAQENENSDVEASDDDDDDDEPGMDEEAMDTINETPTKPVTKSKKKTETENINILGSNLNLPSDIQKGDSDYESDDDEEEDDDYLQKFDKEMRDNYILNNHVESLHANYDEIYNMAKVVRNKENIIVDDLHKTDPILTKYEKTKILGLRAKQINNGAKPYIKVDERLIDGYLIAVQELKQKKIPVIIRRPLPNGTSEYWPLQELEII